MKEAALVLIKPDGINKSLVGEILSQFFQGDLQLIGLKIVRVSQKLAIAHYGHLRDKSFFKEIVSYLTGELHDGKPVIAMVLSGTHAVKKCRHIAGATNPEEARPRSIRGKMGRITTKGVYENLVHVSSNLKEAAREIKL